MFSPNFGLFKVAYEAASLVGLCMEAHIEEVMIEPHYQLSENDLEEIVQKELSLKLTWTGKMIMEKFYC